MNINHLIQLFLTRVFPLFPPPLLLRLVWLLVCLSILHRNAANLISHASFTLPDSLKRELLVAPGTDSMLFNQPLLSTAIENMKEDSLVSSTSSLASIFPWTLLVQVPLASPSVLLPLTVGARSAVVVAGVRLLPQPGARVFGGRSHAPVQLL